MKGRSFYILFLTLMPSFWSLSLSVSHLENCSKKQKINRKTIIASNSVRSFVKKAILFMHRLAINRTCSVYPRISLMIIIIIHRLEYRLRRGWKIPLFFFVVTLRSSSKKKAKKRSTYVWSRIRCLLRRPRAASKLLCAFLCVLNC